MYVETQEKILELLANHSHLLYDKTNKHYGHIDSRAIAENNIKADKIVEEIKQMRPSIRRMREEQGV
jgi:CHAD domain-containing protein